MQIFFFVLLLVAFVSTVSSQFYQNHGSERIPRQIYDDFKYSRRGRQASAIYDDFKYSSKVSSVAMELDFRCKLKKFIFRKRSSGEMAMATAARQHPEVKRGYSQ
ncbi:hypothetical protein Y032_0339g2958 [Ancylostoma ceylanicum]|uniref:Uncharacterized protein n=1 Tax=Ancylostoma ceylanicum TaxID=53326 RepID=A0A016RYS6_9BILA|nr:hypothetical protein Y032_0339g2958 [Ancylostoma ceylanicum]